jgi:AraC-like DNA-binding protein
MNAASIHYREYLPSSALASYVRAYFTFSSSDHFTDPQGDSPFCPALFAGCGTSLVIKVRGAWHVDGLAATQADQRSGIVVGPITSGRATYVGKGVDAIGAYFFPGALARFTALPLAAMVNDAVPLENVFSTHGDDYIQSIGDSTEIAFRLMQLDSFLTRAASMTADVMDPRIGQLCALLAQDNRCSIAQAALACHVSRQYLTRLFRAQVGVTPKMFARVERINRVLQRVSGCPHSSWSDVAAQFGYVDQSHLIAEFREFTTLTPAAFVASQRFHPFAA